MADALAAFVLYPLPRFRYTKSGEGWADRVTTKLSLQVKQAGGMAYAGCFNQSSFDVLMDDELFAELAALWDCATLETLQTYVAQTGSFHPAQAYLRAVCAQIGAQDARVMAGRRPQPAL